MHDVTTHGDLPAGLTLARTTDEFTDGTVPAGLLRAHRVADGVWGRLVVRGGSVGFVFEDAPDVLLTLSAGDAVVIPPGRLHHVRPGTGCRFVVEFHRAASDSRSHENPGGD